MNPKTILRTFATGIVTVFSFAAVGAAFDLDYSASAHSTPASRVLRSVAVNGEEQLDEGVLRQIVIPTSVAPRLDGQLQVGDELNITLFDDRVLTLVLAEQTPSSAGVASFLATADGYDGEFVAVVVQMDGRIQIDIQDYRAQRVYSVLSSEERTIVREMDPHKLPIVDASAKNVPVKGAVMDNNSVEEPTVEHGTPPEVSADNEGTPTVDILVAYDTDAATWAKSNGGISGFAETQVQKMNTAIANTGLNSYFRFRLVGVYEIGYSAGGNIADALYAAYDDSVILNEHSWSGLRAKRDEVEADIVCVLVDNGYSYGTTGIGNSLKSDSVGFSEVAYNATLIRAVSQGHTMTHEVGHNMGAGHSAEMHPSLKPGPQYHDWSSGYYFYIGSTGYHTIMAYNDDGYGHYYTSVPYFSSPSYKYQSVVVGDATHDNTRTLKETYLETSKYRGGVVASVLGTATETESYTWETSALYPWTRVTGTSNDGVDSARSGSDSPNTWMRTRVVGPATLTFYYKMKSYKGSFEVTCDGSSLFNRKNQDVTDTSFTKVTASIPSGTHVVKFAYTRSDYWYSDDGVWVDQITFSGGSPVTDSYTVTYKPGANGTGSQQTATKTKDVALTLKGAVFTRTGYTQTGWATSDGGSKAYNLSASYTANAAITLYPYWTANTYAVTLNRQNGNGGTASVTATYGSAMPSITVPTRSGYTFGGYFTSTGGSGTQYYTASGTSARTWDKTSETTLYAKWTVVSTTYTVTYKPGANGTGSQQTATKTKDVALTLKGAVFTRTGYTQTGWATSDGGSKAYNLSASYTANAAITLYPYWTANTYAVTLNRQNGNGGTASVTATYGSAMPPITVPTRSGYTFGGYFTSTGGSGTQYYTASGSSARTWDKTSVTTLYAKWTATSSGPANDSFSSPTTIFGSSGSTSGSSVGATMQTSETKPSAQATVGASVWYKWTAPGSGMVTFDTIGSDFDTVLAVYTGTSVSSLSEVVSDDDGGGSGYTSKLTFHVDSGITYRIAIYGYDGETGNVSLRWTTSSSGPANDNFSSPMTIYGTSGSISGNNVGATLLSSEPRPSAQSNSGASVWYEWTAPSTGTVTFDTIGSDFDTVLAVYTGTSVYSLYEVASDDDGGGSGNTSKLSFQAVSGTTYRIAIYGYSGRTGSIILQWTTLSSPSNDDFLSPMAISGSTGSMSGSNAGATMQTYELRPSAQSDSGASVWYMWTAPSSGIVTFDTIGSSFDTVLAVYTGTSSTSLSEVASDDDGGGSGNASKLTFQVTPGTTYLIAIYGYNGESGSISLKWNLARGGGECLVPLAIASPWTAVKAETMNGAMYDSDCNVIGVVQLKVGKPKTDKRKGSVTTKVTGHVMLLDGKKKTFKSAMLPVPSTAPLEVTAEVNEIGTLTAKVGSDGFAGTVGGYVVRMAHIGGDWTKTDASVMVDFASGSALPAGTLTALLPYEEPVVVVSGKWRFNKAASIKLKNGAIVGIDDPAKPNLSGLRLTYMPKKGTFKGFFNFYVPETSRLKKHKVNVSGIVVDGVGYGKATCKMPALSWLVTVE